MQQPPDSTDQPRSWYDMPLPKDSSAYRGGPDGSFPIDFKQVARELQAEWGRLKLQQTVAHRQTTASARSSSRPRGAGRPRSRRVARASTRSGDSGDDPPSDEPPPAAREAVARAWEATLRRRHPGVAWEVRP